MSVSGAGSVEQVDDLRWELVIFDNDGVVVDSEPLASVATSETLTALGHPMTADECDQAFRGISLPTTRRLVEQASGRELPADFEERYLARVAQLLASELRPVPGIEAVLDLLDAAGLPYCMASSSRREVISLALTTTGLAERFAGRWWGAEDVADSKPAPDIFLLAARSMGARPENCVVVEDSEAGARAGRAAGMAVLGFAARTPPEQLALSDEIFTNMAELPALLLGSQRAQVIADQCGEVAGHPVRRRLHGEVGGPGHSG
jgi:HAD superfamily hydrolase (TIGR01509 family)